MNRRRFVQLSSLASASLLVPEFLKAAGNSGALTPNGRILVVLQLSGGNDGLNTVIPVRNDLYYAARPVLGIPKPDALLLTDEVGLHPALAGIRQLYDAGSVTLLNGVGYPEPDRSHFRSMDIWQSGSSSSNVVPTGWLGRYLDRREAATGRNTHAVEVDDTLSLALKGATRKGLAVPDVKRFAATSGDPFFSALATDHDADHHSAQASYLYRTLRETTSSASYLLEQTRKAPAVADFPDTPLGKRMKTIATLILSGADTQIYYASHGSFDTHAGQKGRHGELLKQLDGALTAFARALHDAGRWNDVLVMTFSEFGRRVAENQSAGTDHGTAAPLFLLGGSLKSPGLYNPIPDLNDLDAGDLRYTLDFRDVYATVLDRWLQADSSRILDGTFKRLPLV